MDPAVADAAVAHLNERGLPLGGSWAARAPRTGRRPACTDWCTGRQAWPVAARR
ncbi:hypothetical protein QJS66_18290 [Kocuria rhizophila]|nr:hypothetical protein QJS66_18290 [Kocuria rhizophila]